jgi:hypothetical protein
MADEKIRVTAGRATVEIDQTAVIQQIDKILDGAVRTFLTAAHRQMDPVIEGEDVRRLWPRRTGASAAATREEDRIGPTFVELVALNDVPYTYQLRFSVVTEAGILRESSDIANRTWSKLEPYVERGTTPKARRALARRWIGEASGGLMQGWWSGAEPSARSIYDRHKRGLNESHGRGAPSERLAGKHVWSTLVRNPLKKREAALIEEARDALDTLTKG